MNGLLIIEIPVFGLTLWLGLYLISRELKNPRLLLAGLGLISYAIGLAFEMLRDQVSDLSSIVILTRLQWPLLFFPALLWTGVLTYLLPENLERPAHFVKNWRFALFPLAALCYVLALSTNLLVDITDNKPRIGPLYIVFVAIVLLPLLVGLGLVWQEFRRVQPKKVHGALIVSILFFLLSTGLLLLPLDWFSRPLLLGSLDFDLILLGLSIAVFDAFDQGEALLPHLLRSFDFSFFTALLFGGQVALIIIFGTGLNFSMLLLLLATIATSITVQTFATQFGTFMDRIALAYFPGVRQAEDDLRVTAETLPRLNPAIDLENMDDLEFTRLTRKALSYFGDLTRLAASPLTYLPQVEQRLTERGVKKDDALERAAELKAVLSENIARLKPRGKANFGTADEWRYYNALYFPYVVGLKPYSLRTQRERLDPDAQQAFEWFRDSVPERTLYNWQTAAAKLVAQSLREEKAPALKS